MGLIAKQGNGGDFELAPAGSHIARCCRVIDLGTQYSEQYRKSSPKVLLTFELCDEKMSDGQPFTIHARFTSSLHKKAALRQVLESWRGKAFTDEELEGWDIGKVLGAPCMISVIHNAKGDKTYANIASVAALPKGVKAPELKNPMVKYAVEDGRNQVFEGFSDGLKQTIAQCEEWKTSDHAAPEPTGHVDVDDEDNIPF